MKLLRKFLCAVTILIAVSCQQRQPFTIVLLPDTQCYSEFFPDIFYAQTNWIADRKDSISFVLHQGDITNRNAPEQWEVASRAMRALDGKVPYVLAVGNHDIGTDGSSDVRDTRLFNTWFPQEKQSQMRGFMGTFEEEKMENAWFSFQAGGLDWLVLTLEFGPRNKVLEWASSIIESHPRSKVIINTHAYMYSDETRMSAVRKHHWLPQYYGLGLTATGDEATNDGEAIWQKLASRFPNVFLVLSGHVLNDGVGTLVSEGEHGNKVYQMLANYQCGVAESENGGNGFLRILTFDPQKGRMSVRTYSPYIDQYKRAPDHEFTFDDVAF